MPPTPDAMMVMVTEPQSGSQALLGKILGRYTGCILPLLGAVAVPRRASREGAMVFAFSHLSPLAPRYHDSRQK